MTATPPPDNRPVVWWWLAGITWAAWFLPFVLLSLRVRSPHLTILGVCAPLLMLATLALVVVFPVAGILTLRWLHRLPREKRRGLAVYRLFAVGVAAAAVAGVVIAFTTLLNVLGPRIST